jgi:hypothetical protein
LSRLWREPQPALLRSLSGIGLLSVNVLWCRMRVLRRLSMAVNACQSVVRLVLSLVLPLQVKHLVERAYRRAKDLVQSNINILHDVAAVLMEKENVDGDEFQRIILASKAKQYLKQDAPEVSIPYQ